MTTVPAPTPDPAQPLTPEARRALVQTAAMRYYQRKVIAGNVFLGVVALCLVLALIPLIGILWSVVGRAQPFLNWKFVSTYPQLPDAFHPARVGGVLNAITASFECVGIALVLAIPFGIVCAMFLFESKLRVARTLRLVLEVMVGMPSILFGLFVLVAFVKPDHNTQSLLAGSLALAVLMLPLIAVATEDALRSVPGILTEAGLALGAKNSRVMARVVFPYARPRVLTGVLLALSRAVGETAPIIFIMGASGVVNFNPLSQATTLPGQMWNLFSMGFWPRQFEEIWGIGFLLIAAVFVINLTSRVIVARANRGQS